MHGTGNHNAKRRPHLLHRPNLYRRSMRAQEQPLALRLPLLPRDEQSILRIPRRMVHRKIQRLEVVIVGLDNRPLSHGVAKLLKNGNDLMHRLDDRMLGADGTANARKRDIDDTCFPKRLRLEFGRRNFRPRAGNRKIGNLIPSLSISYGLLNLIFDQVHLLADLSLRFLRRTLQPEIVNLRQHAILARHPSVTKYLPPGLVLYGRSLTAKRKKQVSGSALQRRRRIIRQFRNTVHGR